MKKEEQKKILFLDLDGTLLNDEKKISTGNIKAIKKALSLGHKIVITTGRPMVSARLLSQELGLTEAGCYAIAFNGGEIYDLYQNKSIFKKTISFKYVRKIFDAAYENSLHCQTYDDTYILSEKDTPALRLYEHMTNIKSRVVDDVIAVLPSEPVKVIVISYDDPKALSDYRNATKDWSEGNVDRILSCPQYLEHVAPGVSKGAAIQILSQHLDIPMSNTIAAGDAENDISMIKTAALGVVMKNAAADIQKYGDYVTRQDNNHDGVAEIIEKFLL